MEHIRNFCIIAHIDHGKSTLADRFLELTHTVPPRKMREQILDQMSIERERGITIKLQPVTMNYEQDGKKYVLNLIDTPGHVDFNYEVSRSLAAVEGAILLVDATQGIQAQTLANLYLALGENLVILPVLNKIDLPNANIPRAKNELTHLLGADADDLLLVSAKTGSGVKELLEKIIKKIPPPHERNSQAPRAIIFDSKFDEYRGVITYVRVFDGVFQKGDRIRFLATNEEVEILEVGILKPDMEECKSLGSGSIGYVVTGVKEISESRVGDTLTLASFENIIPLPGYREVKPMVFAGVFSEEGDEYPLLREAIQKLKLNDAALFYEPEHSKALGFGFRCGFLGMLHAEIFLERLRREFSLEVTMTVPSVAYRITLSSGEVNIIHSPQELPHPTKIRLAEEPIMRVDIVTPKIYMGAIMQFLGERHGIYRDTEYLQEDRVVLHYDLPLIVLLVDFYDKLKSISSGYASLNYEFLGYKEVDIVRLQIFIAQEEVEALSSLVYKEEAYQVGRKIVDTLLCKIPRQQFAIKIQASVDGKILASDQINPFRKDVTAKLYGGDYTRKRKLLEKQKKGKKRMKVQGRVQIPPEAYLAVLKR